MRISWAKRDLPWRFVSPWHGRGVHLPLTLCAAKGKNRGAGLTHRRGGSCSAAKTRALRKRMQMVRQVPSAGLKPRAPRSEGVAGAPLSVRLPASVWEAIVVPAESDRLRNDQAGALSF